MIVDASIAVKWLYIEDDTPAAMALLSDPRLIAPDLVLCEVANAVWKRNRNREGAGIPASFGETVSFFTELVPSLDLVVRATAISLELSHPVYDCFYLALAEARDLPLVTADLRFIKACAGTRYASRLKQLDPS